MTDKLAPQPLGFFPTSSAIEFVIRTGYLYLADYDGGLRIFDVREPVRPELIGGLALPGRASAVALASSNAVVACDGGLRVVDISDPKNPKPTGSFAVQEPVYGIAVFSPNLVAVAAHSAGLLLVNISDPKSPQLVSAFSTRDYAIRVAISGTLAFVGEPSGLEILDLVDPFSARSLSFTDFPGAEGMQVLGTTAFLGGLSVCSLWI